MKYKVKWSKAAADEVNHSCRKGEHLWRQLGKQPKAGERHSKEESSPGLLPSQKPWHSEHYIYFVSLLPFSIFCITHCNVLLQRFVWCLFFVCLVFLIFIINLFFIAGARCIGSLILIRPSRHSYTNNCILPDIRNISGIKASHCAWKQVCNSLILLWNIKHQNFTESANMIKILCED